MKLGFIFTIIQLNRSIGHDIEYFISEGNNFKVYIYIYIYIYINICLSGFSSQTLTIHRTAGEGREPSFFHSTTSNRSRTLRPLFATLHVRWLSRIFNRNACVYQTATRWDLPPYRFTIWVIDWLCSVCLFSWWIDTWFLLQRFDIGNGWIWPRIAYHPCITSD